eukprot:363811-Chlamydomonas_euryale.AAC.10
MHQRKGQDTILGVSAKLNTTNATKPHLPIGTLQPASQERMLCKACPSERHTKEAKPFYRLAKRPAIVMHRVHVVNSSVVQTKYINLATV